MEYGLLICVAWVQWHIKRYGPFVLGAFACGAVGYFLRGWV